MKALSGEFPHQVSLQMYKQHFCGGSIIDATHILTAAHCVVSGDFEVIKPELIQVITGVTDKEARSVSNSFAVTKVIPHKSFTRSPHENDIAILKVTIWVFYIQLRTCNILL